MPEKDKRGEASILIIRWSETCNNRCVICSLCGGDKKEETVLFEDILKQLDEGRKVHHENVEFTGGEPTMRPRLDEAIAYAKKIGYRQIGLSTNGRLLADQVFSQNLVDNGLTEATIALHGPDAATHDRVTNSPGSFDEII
jgi:molybdenum cofactor biosynthesis enzyme MoaA